MNKRFFISWEQIIDTNPRVDVPEPEQIKAFWLSGCSADGSLMHAIVDTDSMNGAEEIVRSVWEQGEAKIGKVRFIIEHAPDWLPSDIFAVTEDWAKKRLGLTDG